MRTATPAVNVLVVDSLPLTGTPEVPNPRQVRPKLDLGRVRAS
jgi:hypothetical protein